MDQTWPRPASRHVWLLFLLSCLFALPIFLANVPYMDDNARALYGYTWSRSGRIFSTFLMNALSLRAHNIPDIAPLGQMLGLLALAYAGALLAARLMRERRMDDLSVCLCGLPLAVQPFFLENLSYKFDALPMLLAQTCAVLATLAPEGWSGRRRFGACGFFLFTVMCFYQPALNTFLAISLLLFVCDVQQNRAAWRMLGERIAALGVSYGVYKLVVVRHFVHGSYAATHDGTMTVHEMLHGLLWGNLHQTWDLLHSLLHGIPGLVLGALYALGAAFVWGSIGPALRRTGPAARLRALALLAVPFALVALVPGIVLSLSNPVIAPRIFMSFSACVILGNLFFVGTMAGQKLRWLAVVPLLYFYVTAFSFGNVMQEQVRFERMQAERVAVLLDEAGFRAGDDLFLYGRETQAPIVQNAIAAQPYLGQLLPRQAMEDDAFFGYTRLRQAGINSREHSSAEWDAARALITPATLVHQTPNLAVYRDDHRFAVAFPGA